MTVVRVVDPDGVRPVHVVMLCLLAATLAGSCLLTSGAQATLEGAKDWREESPLRAIVHVLNLNYTQTTAQGVEIKSLVFGVGAAMAALVYGLSMVVRPCGGEEVESEDTVVSASPGPMYATDGLPAGASQNAVAKTRADKLPVAPATLAKRQMSPLASAQLLMVAYVAWSFASAKWSTAPDLALGGSMLLAIGVVWSLGLGRGLNRPTAHAGACVLLAVCAVTAILAIAYHGERNPVRRASYPIGNPLFLAACLIPGVLLAVGLLGGAARACAARVRLRHVLVIGVCIAANVVLIWAMRLTSARSGALAAVIGLAALLLMVVPRRARVPVLIASAVFLGSILLYAWPRITAPSPTGRDASLRMRVYAWWYAIDLIEEAKFLGHGQGGFTQFGDAYAADDVIDAPLALGARIAHAHNEWLETCADLGAIGLTLVMGALTLTVVAGVRALPGLPSAAWRWTLAALMASLVAIAVEECADTGLRIAGLPTVFYSVLGLIWALSRKPEASDSSTSSGGPLQRRLMGCGCGVLSFVVLWAALGDFASGRAYFETLPALRKRAFDQAVVLADRATRRRLSPQRRLEAHEGLCRTHLYIAREYQTSALERYAKARTSQPADERLLALGAADRERSENHITEARGAFDALIRRSPSFWGAGWLEFRLYQLRNAFAELDGDIELSSRITSAAYDAIKRELKRRPYDPEIALTCVAIGDDRVDLSETLDILARPLRHSAIPSGYVEFVGALSSVETFDREFVPIWERIKDLAADAVPGDPLAPEKLRLAALIRFLRDDYGRAADTARMAMRCYDALVPPGTIGHAACSAELADYSFFSHPTRWPEAIRYAENAVGMMPDSTPGRQLAQAVKSRAATYYLAGGDETSARRILGEVAPNRSEGFISAELGMRYAMLCKNLLRRDPDDFPPRFSDWVTRSLELDPANELAWRLNAQVAFDDGRLGESVDSLRQALQHGADPHMVYAFVQLALSTHPDAESFQSLGNELRAFLSGATGRIPGSAPAGSPAVPKPHSDK